MANTVLETTMIIKTSGPKMVHDGIFIGNGYDADQHKFAGSVLHCAKDPWYVQTYVAGDFAKREAIICIMKWRLTWWTQKHPIIFLTK